MAHILGVNKMYFSMVLMESFTEELLIISGATYITFSTAIDAYVSWMNFLNLYLIVNIINKIA